MITKKIKKNVINLRKIYYLSNEITISEVGNPAYRYKKIRRQQRAIKSIFGIQGGGEPLHHRPPPPVP